MFYNARDLDFLFGQINDVLKGRTYNSIVIVDINIIVLIFTIIYY